MIEFFGRQNDVLYFDNAAFSLIRASAGLVNNESNFAALEQRLNNIDL